VFFQTSIRLPVGHLFGSLTMLSAFSRFGGLVSARVLRRSSGAAPSVGLGIGFSVLAFLLFSSMDMMVKLLSAGYPIQQMLFYNALFSLLPIGFAAWRAGGLAQLRTRRPVTHLLRACFGMVASFAAMTGFSMMPMADVYAILFATPLLVTALSVPLLGEQVGWRRWSAILLGFAGVMIMLQPASGTLGIGTLAALGAALSASFSVVLVRKLSATESTASIALYSNLLIVLVMGGWLLLDYRPMPLADIALAAAAGIAGGMALLSLIGAYRRAAAAIVAPFQYSQMIWGVVFGFVVFGDLPSSGVVLGSGIVVASGLFIIHRELMLARPEQAPAAKPLTPTGMPAKPA
jgi:drug/metabolite transporter (DMT)-like permease